jgi:hypothetical protein
MTQNASLENDRESRIFKASRPWESNVWGATVAGIGAGLLILVVSGILLFDSAGPSGRRAGLALILTIIAMFLAMFPGNLIAAVPVAVELKEGKGLRLIAPLKKLYIGFEEVQEVRDSTVAYTYGSLRTLVQRQICLQAFVVKLNKRHGLLKSFAIYWAFGDQGRQLAQAIQREISRRE